MVHLTPRESGRRIKKKDYKSGCDNRIVVLERVSLNTIGHDEHAIARLSLRLRYQIQRIRILHAQARESGVRLDPEACAHEFDDAIKWAARVQS